MYLQHFVLFPSVQVPQMCWPFVWLLSVHVLMIEMVQDCTRIYRDLTLNSPLLEQNPPAQDSVRDVVDGGVRPNFRRYPYLRASHRAA